MYTVYDLPVAISHRRHQDANLNLFHRALAGSVIRRILAARRTRRFALQCPARFWHYAYKIDEEKTQNSHHSMV